MSPIEDSDQQSYQGCSNDNSQFIQQNLGSLNEKADEILRKKQEAERLRKEQEAERLKREKGNHLTDSI